MSLAVARGRMTVLGWLDRATLAGALATPVFSVHGRGLAEAVIFLTALLFLARSALAGDWAWLRTGWVRVGLAWWGWLVICSVPVPGLPRGGLASEGQALLTLRFLLLAAALEHLVLREARVRRWLGWIIRAAAFYIAAQVLLQFATGHNLFGDPRNGDGELTGPYDHPRAGAPLSILLFPALLPLIARLNAGRRAWGRVAAAALALGGIAIMVLIGQRMPLLLTGLGLAVSALLLPRLRTVALAAAVAGVALVGASAVVAPPTFHRLVVKFSTQMEHFRASPYGVVYARALAIAGQHPWTGLGFDGFRDHCMEPRYFHGWSWPENPADDGGGLAGCEQHPHNFALQAATDAGLPGLALFAALVVAWLASLGRGLERDPDPLRVGLFAAVLMYLWPIASASSYTSMPLSGFFFTLLGWGLAEARHRPRRG